MGFLFLKICILLSARAEYRAYQLNIVNADTKATRPVPPTTLDHLQYPGYYTIQKNEYVQIVSTWMCPGRTDNFEPICSNPRPTQNPLQVPPGAPPAAGPTAPLNQPQISSNTP